MSWLDEKKKKTGRFREESSPRVYVEGDWKDSAQKTQKNEAGYYTICVTPLQSII